MAITNDTLKSYADLLHANGFDIYAPKSSPAEFFAYSQTVDGVECFGYVQAEYFGGFSHLMPITPSRVHGSNMEVEGVAETKNDIGSVDCLTVEVARLIARPTNKGRWVGVQRNHKDAAMLERMYDKW